MPIYEFKCTSCQHKMEKLCKMGEDGSSFTCPQCEGRVQKVLSLFRSSGTDSGGSGGCGPCTSTSCSSCG
ncbi:MAG: zinc ribbon domain-containing protein [Candidatus Syntrophonatronum acetioxidans]|uniref:Zinc ribbon domain-containing protein n=1 Tax=Candidatus Syntrophonatronum acetioxidans TaxID=1795816 RepID=A0A424YA99_9FIRM|nr:MAG: zinc ribbon domain-containing protein [Candidatus Syntrophonatronum acetioxidans]